MDDYLKYQPVYSLEQEEKIAAEFNRTNKTCYLDHAGAALYSEKQMQLILSDLCNNIYANPHSLHLSSKLTEDHIDVIRFRILQHFNTSNEDYSIIFTSGATQSIKIVAESFDYGSPNEEGTFVYLQNNHTSVLGMRCYAKKSKEIKTEDAFMALSNTSCENKGHETGNSLFAYPAQCNFSGTKYPLNWIESVHKGALNSTISTKTKDWYVLLDAACFLANDTLDLSEYKPDFVTVSFYKIFGYPTGLGALLVRKNSESVLKKKYFGGGTVLMALSEQNLTIPRKVISDRFEDGSLPFLAILSLQHGFDTMKRLKLTWDEISQHTFHLAKYVYHNLLSLHHSNGQPVAILHHETTFENLKHQGGIVNFSLLRDIGDHVGYSESGHVCGDQRDLIDGRPTGTIRISFGYMSTKKDADQFLKLIEDCFVSKPVIRKIPNNFENLKQTYKKLFYSCLYPNLEKGQIHTQVVERKQIIQNEKQTINETGAITASLEQIILYPIKSCGAFSVTDSWIVNKKGLKYDREWMIVNAGGVCLTQKQNKKMCLIKPVIHMKKNTLTLHFRGKSSIQLNIEDCKKGKETYLCLSKVCGDRVIGWDCGDKVGEWLSENLEMPGLRLLKQFEPEQEDLRHQLSFANQAQYLLINSTSVEWLRNQVPNGELYEDLSTTVARFRPNLVVKFNKQFEENNIERITIDDLTFKFSGNCTRCQMICIDQNTGDISKQPLLTLSRLFKGKVNFGIYLNQENVSNEAAIEVGKTVLTEEKTES